VPPVA
jgi:hypothetical protein